MYAGVDCGTQSTKVILIDTDTNKILGLGNAPHQLICEVNGRREQNPKWWVSAFKNAFSDAVKNAGIFPQQINAISVSGQQHGLVVLDSQGEPLYPAKLWCDTETSSENERILEIIGGKDACLEKLGLVIETGYTASKLLWLKENHPALWKKIDTVLLPHDYLNYWLTGNRVMEFGDASGTGLFNIYKRNWDNDILNIIDSSGLLYSALPNLILNNQVVGVVRPEVAEILNLNIDTLVATGSGDNMMGAIGTGNIEPGIVTMSLGTSGTLYAYSPIPIDPASKSIANFCSVNNGWLPLICTMNVTSATSLVQNLFSLDLDNFNYKLTKSELGSKGIITFPFFNGERVPSLPTAKASIHGLDSKNFTIENLCRSIVEGITFGLRYGLELLKSSGLKVSQIRLIGGGSKSVIWRQMVADVMDCEVICLTNTEAAALGAAIQAAWVHQLKNNINTYVSEEVLLKEINRKFVILDADTLTLPDIDNVKKYDCYYLKYKSLLNKYYLEKDI
ncbi:xylulokinase [Chelonobacter oris]|uniref:xylulokinase n=1 Tax=Chelonobacter oris TaxID=505317 RepID=UPI002447964A|nr:xylulokinase [Chelonobacter oris]